MPVERSPESLPIAAAEAVADDGVPSAAPSVAADAAAQQEQHTVPVALVPVSLPAPRGYEHEAGALPAEVSPGSRRKLDFAQALGVES